VHASNWAAEGRVDVEREKLVWPPRRPSSQALALRARTVLACAQGLDNTDPYLSCCWLPTSPTTTGRVSSLVPESSSLTGQRPDRVGSHERRAAADPFTRRLGLGPWVVETPNPSAATFSHGRRSVAGTRGAGESATPMTARPSDAGMTG